MVPGGFSWRTNPREKGKPDASRKRDGGVVAMLMEDGLAAVVPDGDMAAVAASEARALQGMA